jgi:2-dehydro-3-deoxyphosphooctonate aldolase (KDO 8-P synthase)
MTAMPFTLIAGPCVIESRDLVLQVAEQVKTITDRLGIRYLFKASFDKANRSSGQSFRGPGADEGLKILQEVGQTFGVPVLTDIHESHQAAAAAQAVDVLQIPAFLCRQSDLLEAAAQAVAGTNKVVNVKKGQFLAPWDMAQVVSKMAEFGLEPASGRLWLTERGTSFGYNTLVVDYRSFPQLQARGSLWHHLPELPSPWGWTVCSWRPIQTPTTPSATAPTWCRYTGSRHC